jgi:PAS domain S-box-containing protein
VKVQLGNTLLDNTRQLELLVQGVTDYAIYLLDATGHIANWNTGGERIKGYQASEVIGRHFSIFYTEEDLAAGEPQRALRIATEFGKYEKEGWRVRKDGTRFWASVVIDPIWENGEVIGFAKVTRDITERLQAREALEVAQKALLQSQKMEAIGQLTYGLAHDFNNLLTVIINSLDSISAHESDVSRIRRAVVPAQRAADRGALLTKQLLAFSRGQLLRPKPSDVNALIRRSEALLRRVCDETIEMEFDLEPKLPTIDVDVAQFEAALLNLVINARDALLEGGVIRIATRKEPGSGGAEGVHISVSDDGMGMTPEVITRALEPFFTTKEVGKGSGLGLSQVHGFVSQSGGNVMIESTLGRGTTVTLALSAKQKVPSMPEPKALKILMVDDDKTILEIVVDALQDIGLEVLTAANGQEAIEVLQSEPDIDVMFTDVIMPGGMSGIDLAEQAVVLHPGLKVLIASGYSEGWLSNIPEYCDFVPKPYRVVELQEKFKEYAAQRS